MAVIVQEIVVGEKSGVIFGKSPNDDSQAMVEAVHGLNAGLVDGASSSPTGGLFAVRRARSFLIPLPSVRNGSFTRT